MFYRWITVSTLPAANAKALFLPLDVVEYLLNTKQKLRLDGADYTVKNAKIVMESTGGTLEAFVLELTA